MLSSCLYKGLWAPYILIHKETIFLFSLTLYLENSKAKFSNEFPILTFFLMLNKERSYTWWKDIIIPNQISHWNNACYLKVPYHLENTITSFVMLPMGNAVDSHLKIYSPEENILFECQHLDSNRHIMLETFPWKELCKIKII